MWFNMVLLFASLLASGLAAMIPMAASVTTSLDLVSSFATNSPSASGTASILSVSSNDSPDSIPSLVHEPSEEEKVLEARYDLESYRFELECTNGMLHSCIAWNNTYCDIPGALHTDSTWCRNHCQCKLINTRRPCTNHQHVFGCYSNWGQPIDFGSGTLKEEIPPFDFTQAPEIIESSHPNVLAELDTAFWSNLTNPNEANTTLQMCPDMNPPIYVNWNNTLSLTANTSNCIGMMEVNFNPELPPRYLTAPGLYQSLFAQVANLGDCYLFALGGDNATSANMGDDDAFVVGNYDFANVMLNMLDAFADSGGIDTVAACATLNGCPVENSGQEDGSSKTGEIGFRFCVGGAGLGAAAAA